MLKDSYECDMITVNDDIAFYIGDPRDTDAVKMEDARIC